MPKVSKSGARKSPITKRNLLSAEKRLGYKFKDKDLLATAFCHASTGNEGIRNNERLEFLGDSVLNMLVSWFLYEGHEKDDEGALSKRRAHMISGQALTSVCKALKLSEFLRTGKGQDLAPTDHMEADLVEACIGAVFIDGGFEAAWDFVLENVISNFKTEAESFNDPKSRLQHYALAQRLGLPVYEVLNTEGPGHSLSFTVEAKVDGKAVGKGQGSSKKVAAQMAATEALETLKVDDESAEEQKG